MNLTYPTSIMAVTVQAWGNENAKMYPGGRHMGIDLGGLNVGAPILAACDGTVEAVNLNGAHGYGRHIVLKHDDFLTLYAHLHKVFVSDDQTVRSGSLIGEMGGDPNDDDKVDGASTGAHLHFEVILLQPPSGDFVKTVFGWTVDPFPYLMKRYASPPSYAAKVIDPKGVRIRVAPDVSKNSKIIGAARLNETMEVAEVRGEWARLWKMRPEWAAVSYQGRKILELTPLTSTPSTPEAGGESEVEIRLDEVRRMMEFLEKRNSELKV